MPRVLLAKARFLSSDQHAVTPPMGLLYLASVLRQAGHEVALHDVGEEFRDPQRYRRRVRDFRPDVVGLSGLTIEADALRTMARIARQEAPRCAVVAGGPHATHYPGRCLEEPALDAVVIGEGEATFPDLLDALAGHADPGGVPGVATRGADGQVRMGPPRAPIEDLDALPLPAWDLLDPDLYRNRSSMATVGRRRYLPLVSSRGCPYGCIYCHQVHGKRFRARSAASVLHEMQAAMAQTGVREFEFVDDCFNLDRRRMAEILDGVIGSAPGSVLHFPNGLRTDLLDAAQIRRMRQAGTRYVAVAVESASPRIQALARKNLDLEKVRENVRHMVDQGLYVNGFFMLGFPTETIEEARQTVEFALRSPMQQAHFFIVTPFAGTPLFDLCTPILKDRNAAFRPRDMDYFRGSQNVSAMTDAELFGLQREAYRRFYLSPLRIGRLLRAHPRRAQLFLYGLATLPKMLPRRRGNA